jgi:hypothetical protein
MNFLIELNLQEELECWEDEVDGIDPRNKVIQLVSIIETKWNMVDYLVRPVPRWMFMWLHFCNVLVY